MSGTGTSVAIGVGVGVGVGEGGVYVYRPPPFTAIQWQELERQAMIYKYLVAGLPVPPDLVLPIRRSFEALSARFFQHPSLGYCSYYGKKFDPEPGRCRRTDGKKWRCSKDAYPDSKYCERHMHRGRNRSRKPVESQSTSQSLSTAVSRITTGNSSTSGILPTSGSASFQNAPSYSVVSSEALSFGNNATKLQMEPVSFAIDNKDYRYLHGLTSGPVQYNFSSEAAGNRTMGMSLNADSTWRLMPSEVSTTALSIAKSDTLLLGNSSHQLHVPHAFQSMIDSTSSKQRQQRSFFGSEIGAPGQVKEHSMRPFFDEWPATKESWSNPENEASNKNAFSTTQLSISIPMASPEFSSRDT